MCMLRNRYFRGTTTASTPFSYEKIDPQNVRLLRRNGLGIVGTPLDTSNDTWLSDQTITALAFERGGNSITLEDYQNNHFYLVFNLKPTKKLAKVWNVSQIHVSRNNIEIVFRQSFTWGGRIISN